VVAAAALAAGCGKLQNFGGPTPPLATFQIQVAGALPASATDVRALQVALVWGTQWLTEPFCVQLPAPSTEVMDVINAGCRDPFGFVPDRVAANVPITLGQPASLSLYDLPSADLLVGDVTSRIAYGSFVLYDDRDGSGTLELSQPHRLPSGGPRGDGPRKIEVFDSADVVYGASFVTMTAPDRRVAYLEGTFNPTAAFYPRSGCPAPPGGFSVVGAGGFSPKDGLKAALAGGLPAEDPATCFEAKPEETVVTITPDASPGVQEVACIERTQDSSIRYLQPPVDAPDFTDRITVCTDIPSLDAGNRSSLYQLVVTGRSTDRCVGLTHYTLRGCFENVACPVPDWDLYPSPPAWWPCPLTVASP
jgi:hypothetical protein